MAAQQHHIIVAPIENEQEFKQANHCIAEAFGRQTNDGVWISINPGWDTEEGLESNTRKMIQRSQATTFNKNGQPNTIFLKASVPDPEKPGERRVAGLAIWVQLSLVEGYGDAFNGDMTEALVGVDETEKRFATQMFNSLFKRRIEYLQEVKDSGRQPPAIFTLDLCAVDPAFQRRGIAGKLVEYGLEEAKKRGNLECTTEGSAMGRAVYRKLGFKDEGKGDIVFEVEEEFKTRKQPPNVFLRTGA